MEVIPRSKGVSGKVFYSVELCALSDVALNIPSAVEAALVCRCAAVRKTNLSLLLL